jgi:hypothetical protein
VSDTAEAHLKLACREVAEALADAMFALAMPAPSRVAKLAGCVAGFERAVERIRYDVLKQERPKPPEPAPAAEGLL